jgi:DNA-directed RNA polymerase subunit H (RpoH/RPB5)
MDSSLISSIYKSRKTLIELMKNQNYNVDEYEYFSINEINIKYQNKQLDMLLEKNTENNKTKLYIRYYLGKSLRSQIQDIIDDLFNLSEILTKNDTLLIIIKENINDILMQDLKHIWEQDGIFIIVQNIASLQFNILNHILVPPHRILNENEVVTMKQKYNIVNNTQLPEISRFDPVACAIGIRPGEICEITRPSKVAIETKYYRICV